MSVLCMTAGLQPVLCSTKPRTTLLQQVVLGSSHKTVTTGRNGHYKITLPSGRYTVLLKDKKYSIDFQQKVSLKAGNTVHCKDIVGEKNA